MYCKYLTLRDSLPNNNHHVDPIPVFPDTQRISFKNNEMTVQGDHGGQRLHFVVFIFQVPQAYSIALPSLPDFQQPKQNLADSGTMEVSSSTSRQLWK